MKIKFVVCVTLLFALAIGPTWAQSVAGLGGISGTVRDASGAAVPGASVVISNDSKGIRRAVETTGSGLFSAPALVPSGGYSVAVTKTGFSTWEVKNIEIQVGQTVDFNIAMAVGSTSTQVEVTGEAPLVDEGKTGVTQVVTTAQIDNLPINGRRVDSFVLLTPAVVPDGTFGLLSFRGIAAGNSFLTDGNDTTNSFYNENAGRTRISTNLGQDAVQEFQVISDGYAAEFGRAMGGVINTVTRSGSNDVHGTGYWFFRNRTLNATDRYAGGINPPEWRHQAGASIGGPIKKDKIFYFANWEIVERNFPAINRIVNTAFTDSAGNAIIPADCTATAAQCAAAIGFITKQMNVLVPRSVSSNIGFAKIDWRPNEKNAFSFGMNAMHWRSPNGIQTQAVLTGGAALGNNGNSTVEDRFGKAAWTFTPSGNKVNELRFGWFKDRLSDPANSDLFPSTGPLYITVAGSTVGAAQAYPRTFPSENRFQIVENFSYVRGAHSFKVGFDWETSQDWMNQLFNQSGNYSYSSLTNFAKDFSGNAAGAKNYSSMGQYFGNPIQDIRTSDINFYAQDAWKVSRRFTFNYGLRYEKSFLPQPTIVNPAYPATGYVNSPNKDFSPRVSMSYLINDKTVVRAGFGLFYARFTGNGLDTLFLGNGLYQTQVSVNNTFAGALVFPNIYPNASGLPASTVQLTYADHNFRNPYTEQGNIAIERQLAHNIGLTVSYLWTHGVQMWTARDANLAAPTSTGTYIIDDANGNAVNSFTTPLWTTRINPNFGKILEIDNGGQTWYNALAVQVNKRMSHGLSLTGAYTWSHAIDDSNQGGASYFLSYGFNDATYNGNYAADKGTSTLDQRHRAVITFMYSPTIHDGSKFVKGLVNGWQLSQITTLASSQPTVATVASASTAAGGVFPGITLAYSTLNGSGGWNRVPFWPVNSLNIDQIYHTDARLSRTFAITERFKLALMFEAFDVFNTIYNTGVQTQAYSVSGNVLKPTPGLGLGNASQGFPDGTNARRMQAGLRFTF